MFVNSSDSLEDCNNNAYLKNDFITSAKNMGNYNSKSYDVIIGSNKKDSNDSRAEQSRVSTSRKGLAEDLELLGKNSSAETNRKSYLSQTKYITLQTCSIILPFLYLFFPFTNFSLFGRHPYIFLLCIESRITVYPWFAVMRARY